MQINFTGNILVLGCGGVAQCFLPLLIKHVAMPVNKIKIIDFVDNRDKIKDILNAGATYSVDKITKENLSEKLNLYAKSGDIIVDLAWDIGCIDILQWCHDNNVMYINTSVEVWDPYYNAENTPPNERTLYTRNMAIRQHISSWQNKGATAVLEHGANPGLVSHFVKVALIDIANKIITEKPKDPRIQDLKNNISTNNFAKLAQITGTKVIHISERDTQICNKPKEVNEFVNTWSIEGFCEEAIAPAEMGWGTHELELPMGAYTHAEGPKNQICLAQEGIKTKVRSMVPSGEIIGMVVRHGEAFTISDHLTVWSNNKAEYRPTVHYAYCPSDSAVASLLEFEMRQYKVQKKQRIIENEILSGADEVGVLLMGHDFKSWWTGSVLDIDQTRGLIKNQNATTLQVACSALAALFWMIQNPNMGVNVPDDLPYDQILKVAMPYLGTFVSKEIDWDPTMHRKDLELFGKFAPNAKKLNTKDIWQFSNFQIS